MLRKPAVIFLALLLAGVFALGLIRLFGLRYDRGDVYPPYSTLRADPLGASAFYESLGRLPGGSVRRHYDPVFKEDNGRRRALFVLGVRPYGLSHLPEAEFRTIQSFLFSGGRVVIAFFPEVEQTWSSRRRENEETGEKTEEPSPEKTGGKEEPSNEKKKKKSRESDEEKRRKKFVKMTDVHEAWAFHPAFQNLETDEDGKVAAAKAALSGTADDLPAEIPVHTALYFDGLGKDWRTVYAREELPVVVERSIGQGTLVLAADSYPFSNEALRKITENRMWPGREVEVTGPDWTVSLGLLDSRLLVWMQGGAREAVFDEAHLGVALYPGVASLMRKYRLHGLIFSLLLLTLLFIWKNAFSLVPPSPDASSSDGAPVVSGRDSAAGFINLLRRSIPPADILDACLEEWKKTGGGRVLLSDVHRREIEQLARQEKERPVRERRPVETYCAISEVITKRKQTKP